MTPSPNSNPLRFLRHWWKPANPDGYPHKTIRRDRLVRLLVFTFVAIISSDDHAIAQDDQRQSPQSSEPQTRWYSISLDGQPIGYEKTTTSQVEGNPNLVKVFRRTEMKVRRLGSSVRLQTFLWTTQNRSGQLMAFDLQRVDENGQRMERSGGLSKNGRAFEITERVAATRSTRSIPINDVTMSPLVELWLPTALQISPRFQQSPRRQFQVFFPESLAAASINASAQAYRQMILPGGQRVTAARLQYSTSTRASQPTRLLIGEDGRMIQKEKLLLNRPLLVQETSADAALRALQSDSLDLDAQAIIPVDRLISFKSRDQPIQLKLSVDRGFLSEIPETEFQKIQRLSSSAVMIQLTTPVYPASSGTNTLRPQIPSLPPTALMPTDDATLRRMASQGSIGKSDPVDVALGLQNFVSRLLNFTPFSTSILPADTVARQKKGDCSEHAMLLATLLRIKGIPSRIASGLLLTPGRPGFTGHVWVEAQIKGIWYPFDSTSANASRQIRIKLGDSDFQKDSQSTGITLFVPILDLAGRASITVESGQ